MFNPSRSLHQYWLELLPVTNFNTAWSRRVLSSWNNHDRQHLHNAKQTGKSSSDGSCALGVGAMTGGAAGTLRKASFISASVRPFLVKNSLLLESAAFLTCSNSRSNALNQLSTLVKKLPSHSYPDKPPRLSQFRGLRCLLNSVLITFGWLRNAKAFCIWSSRSCGGISATVWAVRSPSGAPAFSSSTAGSLTEAMLSSISKILQKKVSEGYKTIAAVEGNPRSDPPSNWKTEM